VTTLSKTLYSMTQPHQGATEAESPCAPGLMPGSGPDSPINFCLTQQLFVPDPAQLKVEWMHIAAPSEYVPAEASYGYS
jgi:hypothetical protein